MCLGSKTNMILNSEELVIFFAIWPGIAPYTYVMTVLQK
jgi:hypothetical protein